MLKQIASAFISILLFFVLLFGFTKIFGPIPFEVNSINTNKSQGFSVTGEGEANESPSLATVNLGVSATGSTVSDVQGKINTTIKNVTDAVKSQGVDEKDIQTANYNVNPQIDYIQNQKITGYSANTSISVKVRDTSKVGGVIDAATKAGANEVGSPQFSSEDQTAAENEARQKAIAQAKEKAEAAASAAGFKLGKIIDYSESLEGQGIPMPLNAAEGSAKSTPPTPIEPGTNQVKLSVTLTFEVL